MYDAFDEDPEPPICGPCDPEEEPDQHTGEDDEAYAEFFGVSDALDSHLAEEGATVVNPDGTTRSRKCPGARRRGPPPLTHQERGILQTILSDGFWSRPG
jgi:hypothetical protein